MSHWKLEISFEAPLDVAMRAEAEAIQCLVGRNPTAHLSTAIQASEEVPMVATPDSNPNPDPIRPILFVPGETVRCRNNDAEEDSLTFRRAYEVLAIDMREGEVQVRDDLNTRTFFDATRFESALSA